MKNKHIFFLLALTGVGCSDYDLKNLNDGLAGLPDVGDTSVPEFVEDLPDTSPPDETADPAPDPSAPIAVCSVDPSPVSPPFESATWIGNSSYDPDGGEIVDYSWALVAAPGGFTIYALVPGVKLAAEEFFSILEFLGTSNFQIAD